jgi:hypothetical protein
MIKRLLSQERTQPAEADSTYTEESSAKGLTITPARSLPHRHSDEAPYTEKGVGGFPGLVSVTANELESGLCCLAMRRFRRGWAHFLLPGRDSVNGARDSG